MAAQVFAIRSGWQKAAGKSGGGQEEKSLDVFPCQASEIT